MLIDSIRTDGGTQTRAAIDHETVNEYAELMHLGVEFPAVIVFFDEVDNWLADGFHRIEASRKLGRAEIAAEVRNGTRRDALLYAVGANSTLERTNADKRRAVEILLGDEEWSQWSNREIARRCSVSFDLVNRVRNELCERFVHIEYPPICGSTVDSELLSGARHQIVARDESISASPIQTHSPVKGEPTMEVRKFKRKGKVHKQRVTVLSAVSKREAKEILGSAPPKSKTVPKAGSSFLWMLDFENEDRLSDELRSLLQNADSIAAAAAQIAKRMQD